jgi:hypothetical protein
VPHSGVGAAAPHYGATTETTGLDRQISLEHFRTL